MSKRLSRPLWYLSGLNRRSTACLFSSLVWAARSGARVQHLPKLKAVPRYGSERTCQEINSANLCTVCVCVFSSHPFWTSSSLDVPAGVTQEEGHTGFLIHLPSAVRALIFVARRIQPFLSLVDREVEFCVLTN